jgi:hypothetical protein
MPHAVACMLTFAAAHAPRWCPWHTDKIFLATPPENKSPQASTRPDFSDLLRLSLPLPRAPPSASVGRYTVERFVAQAFARCGPPSEAAAAVPARASGGFFTASSCCALAAEQSILLCFFLRALAAVSGMV